MLEEILGYIRSVDTDSTIKRIYLFRKTITEDFFTSVFVIQFEAGTKASLQEEILHKIFRHLDTGSDRQFSLFNYFEVSGCKFDRIENSCVYERES